MPKRKYESFTDEQARKVLRKCGENSFVADPKGRLEMLVRDPSTLSYWPLRQLITSLGGRNRYIQNWSHSVIAVREGYFETPPDKLFDRDRCVKEVRKITPCCDDVIGVIIQYLLPIQYAPGTVLQARLSWALDHSDFVVQYYTRQGRCFVRDIFNDKYLYWVPRGAGFVYKDVYYLPAQ